MTSLNVAMIGCGAAARALHLPACRLCNEISVTVLVDTDLARAARLARAFEIETVVSDYREIMGKVDAAIVAVPHHLHAPIAVELLRAGIHVLVEKPMAVTSQEGRAMRQAAQEARGTLAVGLVRRFYDASQFVKEVIDSHLLGDGISFEFREGTIYTWSAGFMLEKDMAGGGVLIDIGSHVLDLLLWWFGDWARVEYFDDAQGGIEANCEISLHMKSGARGKVDLSRTRDLRNTCIIRGERGSLEVGVGADPAICLSLNEGGHDLTGYARPRGVTRVTTLEMFRRQLADFAAAVLRGGKPLVTGCEGQRAVELIEHCYRIRQPLAYPWMSSTRVAPEVLV